MRTIILSYIERLALEIEEQLRSSTKTQDLIAKLQELKRIKQELLFMDKHPEIMKSSLYRINETITDSSEIRLMDDCDTENTSHWVETTIKGKTIRLQRGDIILKME